ncbi:hypothetical protein KSP39_PZI017916 [Platanthera zijinensis]|uniref:Uncharacterized protein n=1 Tax=Platanthera zijinensis TaxID=2320716 RepID=A0AAP0FZR3_9ASPA
MVGIVAGEVLKPWVALGCSRGNSKSGKMKAKKDLGGEGKVSALNRRLRLCLTGRFLSILQVPPEAIFASPAWSYLLQSRAVPPCAVSASPAWCYLRLVLSPPVPPGVVSARKLLLEGQETGKAN